MQAERATNPNVLLLEAGDAFHGLSIANLSQGQAIVEIMNAMGYDAMVPGEHQGRSLALVTCCAGTHQGRSLLLAPFTALIRASITTNARK